MARIGKKRYINTRFWEDVYISNLDPIEKLLFLYFITNTHTNISGVYEIPIKTIAVDTGIDKEMVEKVIGRFSKDKKIFYIKGWICVMNFHKHQGDSPSIRQGIEKAMSDVPKEIIVILQRKDTQSPHSVGTVPPQPDLSESKSISKSESIKSEHSSEVGILIKSFEGINPACKRMYGIPPQRKACEDLITSYGFERVKNVIEKTLPKTNGLEYFPTITTPLQLRDKWTSLESAIRKYQGKIKSKENYIL